MRYLKVVELALVIAILCGSTAFAQCGPDSIIGKWSWSLGRVEFKADHTVTQESPGISAPKNSGTWVQSGETYIWTNSTGTNVCTIKLSADCEQLIVRFPDTTYDITMGQRLHIPAATDCTVSCDKNKHLVWDGQSKYPDCVCLCENGWKFDANGDCQPTIASQLGQTTGSQGTLGSSIVLNTGQGDTSIKPGDRIILSPQQQAELKAACDKLVTLVRANFIPNTATLVPFDYIGPNYHIEHLYASYLYNNPHPQGDKFDPLEIAKMRVMNCIFVCGKLYSGGYNKKELEIQSASDSLSDQPAQIELSLEEGPIVFEVINDQTFLAVDTVTLKASSTGKNTFGVIHVPKSGNSFVVAYQYPVEVQSKNSYLAPFTLGSGQMVEVSPNKVGPIVSLSQTSGENKNEGSTFVSPDGKDIYGPTGGAMQPASSGAAQGEYPDITGIWYMGGPYDEGRPCQIIHNGNALIFIDENGGQSGGGFVDSGTVVASDWQGLQGKISEGGMRIDWSDGSWWVRNSQQGNSQRPSSGGCYQDPFTGEITCVDTSGDPISSVSGQGNSQEPSSGGCYQDPYTGEITCVDASGNPGSFVSDQGDSQGISSGGCYQDPVTGEITCVDTSGNPGSFVSDQGDSQGISSGGCYEDPVTGEITCVD